VVERVRKNLALKYLNDSRLSLLDIALMLGFTNQTSFHHAFKRWTGQSPGEFRRALSGS
jgi:AraC-like DNA-binding protein